MNLSAGEKALVVALEVLRKALDNSAVATAANALQVEKDYKQRAEEAKKFVERNTDSGKYGDGRDFRPGEQAPAPGDVTGVAKSPESGAQRVTIVNAAPIPVTLVDAGAAGPGGPIRVGAPDSKPHATGPNPALGAITSVLGQVASKFSGIIGPAALLGQVLNAPIAGFQVLSTAVKVLASSLAPVLLPVTLLLSAGMLALSEVVNDELVDAFDDFADLVLNVGVPAMVTFIQAVTEAAAKLKEWYEDLKSLSPGAGLGGILFGGANDALRAGGDTESAERKVNSGLRDTLASLRLSLGPKASTSSIGSVGSQVQQSALNSDPLETRLARQQLAALERIERKLPNPRGGRQVYLPGDGDFSGDQGSGESVGEDF